MSREEELAAELSAAQLEIGELKGRVLVAEKQVEDAKGAISGYLAEFTRIATKTKDMLTSVASIQKGADAVRVRLGKTQKALMAADRYVVVLRSIDVSEAEIAAAKEAYDASKEMLKTSDVG